MKRTRLLVVLLLGLVMSLSVIGLAACGGNNEPPPPPTAHELMTAEAASVNSLIETLTIHTTPEALSREIAAINARILAWNAVEGNIELSNINFTGTTPTYLSFHTSRLAAMTTNMEDEVIAINSLISGLGVYTTVVSLNAAIEAINIRIFNWNNNPQTISLVNINFSGIDYHIERRDEIGRMDDKAAEINADIAKLADYNTDDQIAANQIADRINTILNNIAVWNADSGNINLVGINYDLIAVHQGRRINIFISELASFTTAAHVDDFQIAVSSIHSQISAWNANTNNAPLTNINETALAGHEGRLNILRMHAERDAINEKIMLLADFTTPAEFATFLNTIASINASRSAWDSNPNNISLTGLYLAELLYQQNRITTLRFNIERDEINAEIDKLSDIDYSSDGADYDLVLIENINEIWDRIIAWNAANPTMPLTGPGINVLDIDELTAQTNRYMISSLPRRERERMRERAADMRDFLTGIGFRVVVETECNDSNYVQLEVIGSIFGAFIHLGNYPSPRIAADRARVRVYLNQAALDAYAPSSPSANQTRLYNSRFEHVFINASVHGVWFFENLIENPLAGVPTAVGTAPNVLFTLYQGQMIGMANELRVRHSVELQTLIHSPTGVNLYSGLLSGLSGGVSNRATFSTIIFGCHHWAEAAFNGPILAAAAYRRLHNNFLITSEFSPHVADILYDHVRGIQRPATAWVQSQVVSPGWIVPAWDTLDLVVPALNAAGFTSTGLIDVGYFEMVIGSLGGSQVIAAFFSSIAAATEFYESGRIFNGTQQASGSARIQVGNVVIYQNGANDATGAMLDVILSVGAAGYRVFLGAPVNLNIDNDLVLTWDAVAGTFGYEVRISGTADNGRAIEFTVSTVSTTFDLSTLGLWEGNFNVEIRAIGGEIRVTRHVYTTSPLSAAQGFVVDTTGAVQLAAPQNVRMTGSVLMWDDVFMASAGFTVTVNGVETSIASGVTSLNLSGLEPGLHTITVRANEVADGSIVTNLESDESGEITFRNNLLAPVFSGLDFWGANNSNVDLDWFIVTGAINYRVYFEVDEEWVFLGLSGAGGQVPGLVFINLNSLLPLFTPGTHRFRVAAMGGSSGRSGNNFWHTAAESLSPFGYYTFTVVPSGAIAAPTALAHHAEGGIVFTRAQISSARLYINRPDMSAGEFVFAASLSASTSIQSLIRYQYLGLTQSGSHTIRVILFGQVQTQPGQFVQALGTYNAVTNVWSRHMSLPTDFTFNVEMETEPVAGTFSFDVSRGVVEWNFSGNSAMYRVYVQRAGALNPEFLRTIFYSVPTARRICALTGAGAPLALGDIIIVRATGFTFSGGTVVSQSAVGQFEFNQTITFVFDAFAFWGPLLGGASNYFMGNQSQATSIWNSNLVQLDQFLPGIAAQIEAIAEANNLCAWTDWIAVRNLIVNMIWQGYTQSEFVITGNQIEWFKNGELFRSSQFSLVETAAGSGLFVMVIANPAFSASLLFGIPSLDGDSLYFMYNSVDGEIWLYGMYFTDDYIMFFEAI